ncbi:hypothetical protein RF11_13874 [Thelohanellus kitauei]|uniref:Uncharacterized protein n=1 Tax=Thelohanellus kitauei TaxID=669202 RepID=A0A0C2JDJ9_THEKT|nr:hypothetical protein RF11_13874 [Thelohanellus kitauei]
MARSSMACDFIAHLEPVHSRVQLHRASGVPLGCELKVTPVRLANVDDSGAPEEVAHSPGLMRPNLYFRPSFLHQLGTVLKCQPRPPLSQSLFSSRSITRGYTAAVDLRL